MPEAPKRLAPGGLMRGPEGVRAEAKESDSESIPAKSLSQHGESDAAPAAANVSDNAKPGHDGGRRATTHDSNAAPANGCDGGHATTTTIPTTVGGPHATIPSSTDHTMATWNTASNDDPASTTNNSTAATTSYSACVTDETSTTADPRLQRRQPPACHTHRKPAPMTGSAAGRPDVGLRDGLARKVFDPGGASNPSPIGPNPTPKPNLQPQGHSLHGQRRVHIHHWRYPKLAQHTSFYPKYTISS